MQEWSGPVPIFTITLRWYGAAENSEECDVRNAYCKAPVAILANQWQTVANPVANPVANLPYRIFRVSVF